MKQAGRALAIGALLLMATACGGGSASRFQPGGLAGVLSTYPGATSVLDEENVNIPTDLERLADGMKDAHWKRCRTPAASTSAVLVWYEVLLTGTGWVKGRPRDSGVVVYTTGGDTRLALYVTTVNEATEIVPMEGKE